MPSMASIAIRDPDGDVRALIQHVLVRLGHTILPESAEESADVVVLEPASAPDVEAVRRLRARNPSLPVVCLSILPPLPETLELEPATYVVKPFTIPDVRAAVDCAIRGLRARRAC